MKAVIQMNERRIFLAVGVGAFSAVMSVAGSPATPAGADPSDTTGDTGSTLGVGGPASYTGGSTANNVCETAPGAGYTSDCWGATVGVGGPDSYTGAATANNEGGTATVGVGGVNSYTGGGNPGAPQNGTNTTDRTLNYGGSRP